MQVKDIKYGTTRFDSKVLYASVIDEEGQKVYEGRFDDVMELVQGFTQPIQNWDEVSDTLFELHVMN